MPLESVSKVRNLKHTVCSDDAKMIFRKDVSVEDNEMKQNFNAIWDFIFNQVDLRYNVLSGERKADFYKRRSKCSKTFG